MKTYSEKELKGILNSHKEWLEGGSSGKRANLRSAYLRSADLSGANLSGADLPIFCKWPYSVVGELIRVGCETRSVEEWKKFLASDEVITTKRDTEEFKQIVKVIKVLIAYVEE